MKSTVKQHFSLFAQAGVCFFLLLSCLGGTDNQDVGLITMDIEVQHGDGWYFKILRPDISFIDSTITPGMPYYGLWPVNLWGLRDSMTPSVADRAVYPIYVHRPSGRTDTLHEHIIHSATIPYIGVIRRRCKTDSCYVFETVFPGKVLGRSFIVDEACDSDCSDYYSLNVYSYEGQKKVFESKQFHYWIINRFTTDWYGPLTEQELTLQLKELGIPLPLTLKNIHSPYVMPNMVNGDFADIPVPKHFMYWPHDKKHGDKIIE